jgi:small basic protein (TIGR04137 family)
MSIHRSLKVRGGLARARNVLTRVERIEKLKRDKKFDEEGSVFGLPKVKVVVAKKKKKKAEEGEEGAVPAEGAAEAGAAEAAKPAE